jgi:hypothetical protein
MELIHDMHQAIVDCVLCQLSVVLSVTTWPYIMLFCGPVSLVCLADVVGQT